MKSNYKNQITKILTLFIIAILFVACKKDKSTTTTTPTPTGTLMFHCHTAIDTSEVAAYDSIYVNAVGRKISLHRAQIYLSHIKVVKLDGSEIEIADSKILKTFDTEDYIIGAVPVGNYKTIKFNIGFDATANKLLPTTNSILNHPEMWFGSSFSANDGYAFANISGKIDTTTLKNGSINQMQSFEYKIGSNDNYTSITMPEQQFSVIANLPQYIHIMIDYSKIFDGVEVNHSAYLKVTTKAANSTTIGKKIAANLSKMFSYE
ncbi:MAG: hypothetical protein RJA07_1224 [Bacteroidota bacterium]|jgi:hypothetical protein